ncbi:PAS domain-containing protein [Helicostylum pulchrum]|nr:PAS domain-containing protein [Helicostylum pulchrum]
MSSYCNENFNFTQQSTNWSERILQDIIGLLHILSPSGKVLYCSESCLELTGYSSRELIGKSLTDFIHIDDLDIFARNFQLAFTSLSRIKVHYRIRRKDNTYLLLESIGHPKQDVPDQPPQSFFAIAQPYLSRSNGLLDSFLELKMENECPQTSSRRPSSCSSTMFQTNNPIPIADDSINNHCNTETKYSPSIGSVEFSEMLIRYNQEEDPTSGGMATTCSYLSSNNSATTTVTDILRKDKWKRRKKHRGMDDYVCADCGTTASPEWRKGPHGPKTLCNACGLRWAKKNKKI